jgi:archaellum component FlaC
LIISGGEKKQMTLDTISEQIEELLRDYHWIVREILRLERSLYGGSNRTSRSWGVAQYGIEAAMPKGSGGISQSELAEMDIREERLYNRIQKLEVKVGAIESVAEEIKGEMHKVVYDCMLDGMSYRSISKHLGVSRDKVRQIKDEIVNQLSQNDHIRHVLKNEKSLV